MPRRLARLAARRDRNRARSAAGKAGRANTVHEGVAIGRHAVIWAIAIVGTAAMLASLWRRNWIDAVLVAIPAAALALMAGHVALDARPGSTVAIDPANPPAGIGAARALSLKGDGLRAAQWNDLPARPLTWAAPSTPTLELDFPRQLELGRIFSLTVHRSAKLPARLQLLAENGQTLAEVRGDGDLAVQWLPPVAERLLLRARLLDAGGKVMAEGPVPVSVRDTAPLQVQGRFGAPSFDLRTLDELLTGSNALLDWQVTLGKTVKRSETARAPIDRPDLMLIDAAWFEHASAPERTALLAKVEHGVPLLVLGANASDAGAWSHALQLDLKPQPDNAIAHVPLALPVASLNPASRHAGAWSAAEGNMLWTRQWHGGRIGWLGVGEWHRLAISDPQGLALWWQSVLDGLGVERAQDVEWIDPDELPLPNQRLELCARGVRGDLSIVELGEKLAWQRRPDRADASCVAVWPAKTGWLTLQGQGSKPAPGEVYVFADGDWPQWQAAQRRAATARYAARAPAPAASVQEMLPRWPFAVLFALSMLALWWRERR
jgi:hypothetical protein